MDETGEIFPLVPRRLVRGGRVGGMRSARRGSGSEPAGSRPYRRGDDIRRIDRFASARLSAATGRDEYVVREHYAEEAAHVVVAVDRAPTMALFPETLPWLQKPVATARAARMIADSAREARCPVHAAESLDELAARRALPAGTFVFLLSDFLAFPPEDAWTAAVARGWEVVPVLVQDPVWEATFPEAAGTLLPLADPATGAVRLVRLRRREADARRDANEARRATILERFAAMGLVPVCLARHDVAAIHAAFLGWAEGRRHRRAVR